MPFSIFSLLRCTWGEGTSRQAGRPDQYRGEKCTEHMGSYLRAKVTEGFLYFLFICATVCVSVCVASKSV